MRAPLAGRKSARLSSRSPRFEARARFVRFQFEKSSFSPGPAWDESPDSLRKRPGSATQATAVGAVPGPSPGTPRGLPITGTFLACFETIRHARTRSSLRPSSCLQRPPGCERAQAFGRPDRISLRPALR